MGLRDVVGMDLNVGLGLDVIDMERDCGLVSYYRLIIDRTLYNKTLIVAWLIKLLLNLISVKKSYRYSECFLNHIFSMQLNARI